MTDPKVGATDPKVWVLTLRSGLLNLTLNPNPSPNPNPNPHQRFDGIIFMATNRPQDLDETFPYPKPYPSPYP